VGTSESTVVRYAADLGYKGYPELQAALKESIRSTLTSLQRMELSAASTGGEAFSRSMRADMENIKKTLAETDVHIFDLVAEKLIAARRIYIIGARSATSLAMFLEFYLTQLFDDVRLVQTVAGGEVFDRMLSVGEQDVVIGISFPRYSRRTLDALDFSKKKGAYVVGITDSANSPLAALADSAVFAHNENDCFVDSLVAPMAVLNALIAAVTAKQPEESVARLSEMEQIWDEYNVYKTK
jgi:DNA-binding MurR/RpiR family transcriptional regulator